MSTVSPADDLELRNETVSLRFDRQRGGALRQVTDLASGTDYFASVEERGGPDLVLVCDDQEVRLSAMHLVESRQLAAVDGSRLELILLSRGQGLEVTQTWRLAAGSR